MTAHTAERLRHGWRWIVRFWYGGSLVAAVAWAQVLPGATVEERAVLGAQEYVKKHQLKDPSLTMLVLARFKNALPTYLKQWETLTGVKVKVVESSVFDMPHALLEKTTAQTGAYDILNQFPAVVPEAVKAEALLPLDEYAARGQPDFSGLDAPLRAQQMYQGKLYVFLADGAPLLLVLRQDLLALPGAKEEFKAAYGWDAGCPETLAQWEQLATFFQTSKGQTRWGKTFPQEIYGALGYRSPQLSSHHFPVYFGSLLFDKDMKPRINTPQGIAALKAFTSIVKYMPPDVQTWNTPQIYPFWARGQAFSVMAPPSIVPYGNTQADSKVKGQQLSCVIPGASPGESLGRHAPQVEGAGYMVSRASKHPELAYYFLQWLTGPAKGDEVVAHPQGLWTPLRRSHLTHEAVLARFGQPFVEAALRNASYATSLLMLPGNSAYFQVLDTHLAQVMRGSLSAEEAAKRIEAGWNKVTDDMGRQEQMKIWRSGVESGLYAEKF